MANEFIDTVSRPMISIGPRFHQYHQPDFLKGQNPASFLTQKGSGALPKINLITCSRSRLGSAFASMLIEFTIIRRNCPPWYKPALILKTGLSLLLLVRVFIRRGLSHDRDSDCTS